MAATVNALNKISDELYKSVAELRGRKSEFDRAARSIAESEAKLIGALGWRQWT